MFSFKVIRENIFKVSITYLAYPNNHMLTEIPHGSRDHVTVPDNGNIMLDFCIESTDIERSIFNKVGRVLVKKSLIFWIEIN